MNSGLMKRTTGARVHERASRSLVVAADAEDLVVLGAVPQGVASACQRRELCNPDLPRRWRRVVHLAWSRGITSHIIIVIIIIIIIIIMHTVQRKTKHHEIHGYKQNHAPQSFRSSSVYFPLLVRRSKIEVHANFSEAPYMRSSIPHPKQIQLKSNCITMNNLMAHVYKNLSFLNKIGIPTILPFFKYFIPKSGLQF